MIRIFAALAAAFAFAAAAQAETRCYISLGAATSEGARITTTPDGTLWGRHFGIIHVEASAYYASFDIWLIEGRRAGDGTVRFDTITEVDGDTQYGPDTWRIGPAGAAPQVSPFTLEPTDCEGLGDRVQEAGEQAVG